jgi:hypothetical protein
LAAVDYRLSGRWDARQEWQRDVQAIAQIDGGVIGQLIAGFGLQVDGVAAVAALETVEEVLVQAGGEAASGAVGRTVQGTGSSVLGAAGLAGAAEQLQDGGDAHGLHVGVQRSREVGRCVAHDQRRGSQRLELRA